jgi:XisH protein
LYHQAVKTALEKDGWTITADPLKLVLGSDTEFFIDLAAERLIVASKENEKIAVEVKSFLEPSKTHEFHAILGQYINYRTALKFFTPSIVYVWLCHLMPSRHFFNASLCKSWCRTIR